MAWDFDPDTAMLEIANMIESMVGTDLSFLPLANGSPSTERSIIIGYQSNPEPELPFITLNFEGSDDNDGFKLDTDIIQAAVSDSFELDLGDNLLLDEGLAPLDIFDVSDFIFVPYYDKLVNYSISIRCEGQDSHKILSKVRKLLLVDRFKAPLRTSIFSSIQLIQPITYTPDLLSDEYRDVNTFILTLSTIDRHIDSDPNGGVWDTVEFESTIKDNEQDIDPIITTGSVGPVTP